MSKEKEVFEPYTEPVPVPINSAVDLQMPGSAGTVSISLVQLDKMRADHANAVRYAKSLEEKQALVRVIYAEQKSVYIGKGYGGAGIYDNQLVEKSITYKGFDEFRGRIAAEEREKVAKELRTLNNSLIGANNEINKLEEDLNVVKKSFDVADEELSKLRKEKVELYEVNKTQAERIEELEEESKTWQEVARLRSDEFGRRNRECVELGKKYEELKAAKINFWTWLFGRKV